MEEAQQGADALRDGGGDGGGTHVEAKNSHEEHIQQDIDGGGKH